MIPELTFIPVVPFHDKESMNLLFEQLFTQFTGLQEQEEFSLRKISPPQLTVSRRAGKYTRFYRYQWTKHVVYPRMIREYGGDYFLNIDHSYAHLVKHFPQDRVVSFCHDLTPLEVPDLLKSGFEKFLYKRCIKGLKKCRRIVTISEYTKTLVMKHLHLPENKINVIPLGVNEKFIPFTEEKISLARKKLDGYRGEKLLLHIGHCARYKNIECLLQILYNLNRETPGGYRLVKVGGPFRENQKHMISELGLEDSIVHVMDITGSSLVEYYNMCDFLVMPSLVEGQGLPILEAFRCGLPVLCSDIPVFREIGGDGTIFIDPEKPVEWARYIAQWDNPKTDHQRMLLKAYDIVKNYTWKHCAAEILKVFRNMGL